MIIGRKNEQALLTDILQSSQAEFVVAYGRRRVGKTFLIEQFFADQVCTFFQVAGIQNGMMLAQLQEFCSEIGRVFYGGANIATADNWMDALAALDDAINYHQSDQPIVLFWDEFPWMATAKSQLLQALEYYWNRFWKNNSRIKLIICGSSAAWIIKKIIHHKGGLHNRITHRINLKSFDLPETRLFLQQRGIKFSSQKLLELYFIVGGVPYYLDQIKKGKSLAQNINAICFQSDGILFDEFDKVFSSLFDEHEAYIELVKIIAVNRHGVSRGRVEQAVKRSSKGGTLTQRLQDLEMAGFIKSFLPGHRTKKGLYYRVVDEYSLFYLQWIAPEKGNIALDTEDSNLWLEIVQTSQYQAWRGYAFESFCYKHVRQIKQALGIGGAARIGAWRHVTNSEEAGAQIDLLFDRRDGAVTLCEIKCSDRPFVISKEYAQKLKHKIETYQQVTGTDKQVFLAIISANGLKPNKHSAGLIDQAISMRDLFES